MPTATLNSSSAVLSLHAGNGLSRAGLNRSTSTRSGRSEVTTNNVSTARVSISTASVSALATARSSLPSESSSSAGAAVVGSGVSTVVHQPTAGIIFYTSILPNCYNNHMVNNNYDIVKVFQCASS